MNKYDCDTKNDLILECKWGFDGSSGHSIYKQKFENQDATDEFIFAASFVPLRLLEWADENLVWQNDRHSFWRLCRPIKVLFTKENPDVIRSVRENIQSEIENLDTYFYNS